MLKISMSVAQSPDEDYAPSLVQPESETSEEESGKELPCVAEGEITEASDSAASIESNNTSTSPQTAPSAENRFVREDPW